VDVQNTQMFYFATLATADGRDFFAAAFLSVRLFQMKIEARESKRGVKMAITRTMHLWDLAECFVDKGCRFYT